MNSTARQLDLVFGRYCTLYECKVNMCGCHLHSLHDADLAIILIVSGQYLFHVACSDKLVL